MLTSSIDNPGIWPDAGTWVYEDIVVFQLKDVTEDGGLVWHAKDNIVPIMYRPRGDYMGDLAWLNYEGWWGNNGQTDCWW